MIQEESRRPLEPALRITGQQKSWISSIIAGLKKTTGDLLTLFNFLAFDMEEAAIASGLRPVPAAAEEASLEDRVESLLKTFNRLQKRQSKQDTGEEPLFLRFFFAIIHIRYHFTPLI